MEATNQFGACPVCGECKMYCVGSSFWGTCKDHDYRWYIGENVFSYWREKSPEDMEATANLIGPYIEISLESEITNVNVSRKLTKV